MDDNLSSSPAPDAAGSHGNPTLGEHTGVTQPEAVAVAPSDAAPATDTVSLNFHLDNLAAKLREVRHYAVTNLTAHEAVVAIVKAVDDVLDMVEKAVK